MTIGYNKHGQPYEDLTAEVNKLKEEHVKEIERVKKEADLLMMKKIIKYEEEIARLKDDTNRLAEENSNLITISKQ